jgi:phage terminase Nu1 subunit (DNA packaging protein)
MKPKDVAVLAECQVRNVQDWCRKNGVPLIREGTNLVYDLSLKEVKQFLNRDKKRGRRWPKKE